MAKLSILIPARNESLLQQTIDDIFKNAVDDIEVIVGLDGWLPEFVKPFDLQPICESALKYIHTNKSIGQRAMTNKLARMSEAQYFMKVDAHCSFGPGFDRIMMESMDDKTILSPQMGVLNPDNWAVNGRKMTSRYCFGRDFVMKYDEETDEEEPETMCLQGSAWMISRENYWKWNVCDESLGSWGGQAVELGIAAYLNGGRCKTTKKTYYGHVFRHEDKEFPYDRGENPGKFATEELKRRYSDKIGGLVERFNYPLDWKQ